MSYSSSPAAKKARVPIIVHTVHGWGLRPDMGFVKKKIYLWFERYCARFTDTLIVVADENKTTGLRHKIGRASQYKVIRSGIKLEKPHKKKTNKIIVGTIGRLEYQKCPEDFVSVAEIVCAQRPDVTFVFVGDGPKHKKIETLIRKKGLQDSITLLGFRNDIDRILSTFSVFLLTSRYEGLPRVVLLARATRVPVVSTDVNGVSEAIIEGVHGYLAPVHDVETLARQVLFLLDNPKKANQIGKNGPRGLKEFSLKKMLADLEALYEELIKKKKKERLDNRAY